LASAADFGAWPPAITTPMLLKVVQSGKLQPRRLVTHRFALNDIVRAYDTFAHAATESALKVILKNDTGG
jgi:alcohol dehydrogenase